MASVFGMGGIGKTELALQYARQYFWQEQQYQGGVCCLSAREVDIGIQIVQFGRIRMGIEPPDDLELTEQVQWLWSRWQPEAGEVLVVFDDVVEYKAVDPYLPPENQRFKVVITTRIQKLSPKFAALELKVLSLRASLDLLRSLVGDGRIDAETEAAEALCEELGCLPLGLELVGQYLAEAEDLSIAEMRDELQAEKLSHPGMEDPTMATTANQGVRAAFELSWRKLSEQAQALGCLLSVFALAPISWELVEAATEAEAKVVQRVRDRELVKRSLLERQDKNTYQLHQLVREFLQEKLASREDADGVRAGFGKLMAQTASQIPQTPTLEDITKFTPLLPHWQETTRKLTTYLEDDDLNRPFTALGQFYRGQGLYAAAEPWFEGGLNAIRQHFGEDHPDMATTLNNLAVLYREQGKYDQAEPLYIQALAMSRKALGEDHPDVAMSLGNLAALYQAQGKYDQAESLHLQALEMKRKILGENHLDMATTLNNLAELYREQGKYDQAEPLFTQALAIVRKVLGEDHRYVAMTLNNLALVYYAQEKYEQAKPLHLQALAMRRKALGEDHPDVAMSLSNLAELYREQGKYDQAEPLHLQALAMRRKALGEDHPDMATSLNNLAELYREQGKYDQAEPLHLQALAIVGKVLGEDHPLVATSLNNLALVYYAQGKYEEAEPFFTQALAVVRKVLGGDHRYVATTLNNLAKLYKAQGKYRQAEPLFTQALTIWFQCLGENHSNSQTGWNNFVQCIIQAYQGGQAEQLSAHPMTQGILEQIRQEGFS